MSAATVVYDAGQFSRNPAMSRVILAAVFAAALSSSAALAQRQQIEIFWGDDASCAAWAKARHNPGMRAVYEYWIRGFASGHNFASPGRQVRVGSLPGGEQLYQYLDDYCKANPTQSFIGGVLSLVDDLKSAAPSPQKPAAPAKSEAKPAAK